MAINVKITSIFDRENGDFAANVDINSDTLPKIEALIVVQASDYRDVPEAVQHKLYQFATELAMATDQTRKIR